MSDDMSDPPFTEGPWDVVGKEIIGRRGVRIITDYGYEGIVWGQPGLDEEVISANQTLIAAAPELYEALAVMIAAFDAEQHDNIEAGAFGLARAALNKARGEE